MIASRPDLLLPSDLRQISQLLGPEAQAFAGRRILVTGGRGFLGRYLIATFDHLNRHVLREPATVVSMDNLITAGERGAGAGAADVPQVTNLIHNIVQPYQPTEPFDFILHCAGIASPHYYRAHPLETLDVAVTGLRNVLELARHSGARLLFFSSSEIYGDPASSHVPTAETYRGNVSCLGPRACYDESKRLGETLCRIYFEQFGVHTTIVRPFNVFGPGMQATDYRVLPNFASRIKRGLPVEVYGSGRQTRTFCYVVDAIQGFLRVLLNGRAGEPYNIGCPSPEISMLELVDLVSQLSVRPVRYQCLDYPSVYPADEPTRRCPDISKAVTGVGFTPVISLATGLRRFLDWTETHYPEGPSLSRHRRGTRRDETALP